MSHLLSTVGQVFVLIAAAPDARVREIAMQLGVTERTVMHALTHLSDAGLVTVRREGRRNTYAVAEEGTVTAGPVAISLADIVRLARGTSPD